MLGYLSLIETPSISELSYRDHVVMGYAALRTGIMDATLGVFLMSQIYLFYLQVSFLA